MGPDRNLCYHDKRAWVPKVRRLLRRQLSEWYTSTHPFSAREITETRLEEKEKKKKYIPLPLARPSSGDLASIGNPYDEPPIHVFPSACICTLAYIKTRAHRTFISRIHWRAGARHRQSIHPLSFLSIQLFLRITSFFHPQTNYVHRYT